MSNKIKQLILKSNQYIDNLKEPYRFITMFLIFFIIITLYSTNIVSLKSYYIILLTLFIWRYSYSFFEK
jgi:hypothetical protein